MGGEPSAEGRELSDYDRLSQVTGWIKYARETGSPEVLQALSEAQSRIKQRLNESKPPHESLLHFEKKEAEYFEKLIVIEAEIGQLMGRRQELFERRMHAQQQCAHFRAM
eukprot:10062212-Alexandrium_andersonii.AAC.1